MTKEDKVTNSNMPYRNLTSKSILINLKTENYDIQRRNLCS